MRSSGWPNCRAKPHRGAVSRTIERGLAARRSLRVRCGAGRQTEHGKCCRHLFEFREGRILVHRHVRSSSRCFLKVRPQDGCTLVHRNLFETDLFTAAAAENRAPAGGSYVVDPLHIISEHRDQVSLPIDDGHDQWQRDDAPRFSSAHLQCDEGVGRYAGRGHRSPRPVQDSRNPAWTLAAVQPSMEVASSHQCRPVSTRT